MAELRPPYDPTGRKSAQRALVPIPPKPPLSKRLTYSWSYFQALKARPPWITIDQVLWIVLGGWALFLVYALAGLGLLVTLIFIPFGLQAMRFAVFAFNPVGREVFVPPRAPLDDTSYEGWFESSLSNPVHPYSVVANVIWLVVIGWELFLFHLFLGAIQVLTVVGVNNGVQHVKLAVIALWPFGRDVRSKRMPVWPAPPYALVGVGVAGAAAGVASGEFDDDVASTTTTTTTTATTAISAPVPVGMEGMAMGQQQLMSPAMAIPIPPKASGVIPGP